MSVSSILNEHQMQFDLKQTLADNRLQSLWRLMDGFRLAYFGATISLGLATAARSATFLLLAYFIDSYLLEGNRTYALPLIASGFVILALFQGVFTFLSGRLAAHTAEGVVLRLRNYLFDHIQRLRFSYHDQTATGEQIQRATSDVDAIRRFFAEQAIGSGRIFFLFVINFSTLLYLNVRLALISVIIIPIIVITSYFFFRKMSKIYEGYQEQEAVLSSTLQENLSGVRVVKAFARQEHEIEKFEEVNQEKYRRGKQLIMMNAIYWPISDILCAGQMLAGFIIGAIMAIDGTITLGTYLAYVGLALWIIFPIRILGRLIVQMSTAMVSCHRVSAVIRQDQELLDEEGFTPPEQLEGSIIFDNVGFVYETASDTEAEGDGELEKAVTPILKNISFQCQPGQRIALLGSTGAGKTSLINLIPRFYDYSSGHIRLDGRELSDYSRGWLRSQIGIVEQEPFLFSRTLRENITYGARREISQAELEEAARAAAIHDVIVEKFPNGYDTLVGERGTTLSGGQKQRVAVARTLLKDPRILILDDSTSAVDTETEALIRRALDGLMEGRTTFIIAHRIQSVMSADLILVMEQGRIVQQGTHDQLMAETGMYQDTYAAQTLNQELNQEQYGGNL